MLNVQKIKESVWQEFLLKEARQTFVQAPQYGAFYESLGEKKTILGILDGERLVGGALVVSYSGRTGKFCYVPYGPILKESYLNEGFSQFHKAICALAKEWRADFIKLSPFEEHDSQLHTAIRKMGYQKSPLHILAETTWILSLSQDTEELFKQFHKKHRNLIRRCEKEGVVITENTTQEGLQTFLNLHKETAKRQQFTPFSDQYIHKEFDAFKNGNVRLFEATYQGEVVSSAIIMVYGKQAAYRHAASKNLGSAICPSYLLQWEVIKTLKEEGVETYNFWGVAPKEAKKHPFKGITRFKTGFGGYQIDLIPAYDFPVTHKYWVNYAVQTVRKIRRGF